METTRVDPEQAQEGVTRGSMSNRFRFVPKEKAETARRGSATQAPYGLEIIESCLNCPYREERRFCDLPPAALTWNPLPQRPLIPKAPPFLWKGNSRAASSFFATAASSFRLPRPTARR